MLKMPKMPRASAGRGRLARFREMVDAVTYSQWLILAGIFSVLMGILVYAALTSRSDVPAARAVETRQAVVARVDIKERTVIEPDMLEVVDYPADFLPAGTISDPTMAVGQAAGVTMQAGDVVTSKKLLDDPALAGFTGAIPPDMRAISVAISDAAGISGFAKPGDYVDVIVVRKDKGGAAGSGELLLQNILLLGVNKAGITTKQQEASEAEDAQSLADQATRSTQVAASASASVTTATLALAPTDALKLSVNAQNAIIYLILRPYRPTNEYVEALRYDMPGAWQAQELRPAAPATAPAPALAPVPAPVTAPDPEPVSVPDQDRENAFGIEIIRGKGAPEAQPAVE